MKLRHALRGTAAGLLLAVCLTTPTFLADDGYSGTNFVEVR